MNEENETILEEIPEVEPVHTVTVSKEVDLGPSDIYVKFSPEQFVLLFKSINYLKDSAEWPAVERNKLDELRILLQDSIGYYSGGF